MYKVIKHFTDLQDNNYAYNVGDTFPHEGLKVTPERIKELSGTNNKRGISLIEEIIEEPLPFTEDETEKPQEKPKPKRGKKRG